MHPRDETPTRAALTGSVLRRSVQLLGRGMASEPRTYLLAVGSSAVFGATTVAISQVLGKVTNEVIVPSLDGSAGARAGIWPAGLALTAVALALAAGVAGRRIFAGIGYADLQAGHRRRITRQLLRLPMSWHRRHPTGQLLSNASSDVEAATSVFNPLPFALGVVVMFVVAAIALVTTDVWIALAAFVILPVVLAVNVAFEHRMTPAATRAQQLRGEVADIAHESFEAALVVKSLGTEAREEARFAERAMRLRDANVRPGVVRAVFDPVMDLLPGLGTLLVLLVGTMRVKAGAVDTGDIVAAAYLLTLLAVPVRAFGWVLGDLPRALVGHERIAGVLDAGGAPAHGDLRLPANGRGAHVELRGVGVRVPIRPSLPARESDLGDAVLLDHVDLDLAPGRTVALVGPTGAGKTTLVTLLNRLWDPTSGTVLLDGIDVRDVRPADLAAQVALVAQSAFVFEDTVRGNVTLCDTDEAGAPTDDEVWAALRLARVDGVVSALPGGLDTPLGERGSSLSGGQRQRLALARALVRAPRLLVLDDATSAVDPRVEQQILTGLRAAPGDLHAVAPTVVMVAYRMSSVLLADEVVHLDGGRVVDRGTHDELLARDPGYRDLATAYERESERRAAEAGADTEPQDQPTAQGVSR